MMNMEYETQGASTFLVYEKQKEDEMDSVTLGMISNNKIEGVIPFVYMQKDESIFLKYNVSAKSTLKQYFSGVVNKRRLLRVLDSLMGTLILAEEYMLEASSFLLDPSYIFVNSDTAQAWFIALPVFREADMTIESFVRNLVLGVLFDQTEDCSYIAVLLSFLNANQFFSIRKLKELTEDLLNGRNQEKDSKAQAAPTIVEKKEMKFTPVEKTKSESLRAEPKSDTEGTSVLMPSVHQPDKEEPVKEEIPEKKGFFAKQKNKKENKKEKKSLFGKKGGTALSRMEVPGKEMDIPGMEISGKSIDIPGKEEKTSQSAENSNQRQHTTVPSQSVALEKHAAEIKDIGNTMDLRLMNEGTTVLTETTLLIPPDGKKIFYLLDKRTGEKFILKKEMSNIGKDSERNDFCIRGNNAVSRMHATIYQKGGQIFIKDNHSTNGTYVGAVRMEPGMLSSALQTGDLIRLGDEELEFRIEK